MATIDPTYRLYNCACCGEQVQICQGCDRGNIYCAGPCAPQRREESLRRAGRRYQRSRRGASRHAARQSAWRQRRREKVTHHGSAPAPGAVTVTGTLPDTPVTDDPPADSCPDAPALRRTMVSAGPIDFSWRPPTRRCAFCQRSLPSFARLGPLRGGP